MLNDTSRILVFNGDGHVRSAQDPRFVNFTERGTHSVLETPVRKRPSFKSLTSPSLRESDLQFWRGNAPPPLDPPEGVQTLNARRVVRKSPAQQLPPHRITPPRPRRDISPSLPLDLPFDISDTADHSPVSKAQPFISHAIPRNDDVVISARDVSPVPPPFDPPPHRTEFRRIVPTRIVTEVGSTSSSKTVSPSPVLGDYRLSSVVPPPRNVSSKRWVSPPCRSYSHMSDMMSPNVEVVSLRDSSQEVTFQRSEVKVLHRSPSGGAYPRTSMSPSPPPRSGSALSCRNQTPPPSTLLPVPTAADRSPTPPPAPQFPSETFRFRSTLPQTPILSTDPSTSPTRPVRQHWVPSQQWVTSMFSGQQTIF
eukprot:TRINITY_DN37371_c0_g1_i1.p1 TRINITY_DN37371_c0_g1~~TRINITY_DN37371_c0_g1_i1.p1  ORF type:complete len:366 (+),score=47.69 TRINITY_DN37371_c0_g1_i1:63-1160(+)